MGRGDRYALARAREVVPGAGQARLLAVCPSGADAHAGFDAVLDATDVVAAFT